MSDFEFQFIKVGYATLVILVLFFGAGYAFGKFTGFLTSKSATPHHMRPRNLRAYWWANLAITAVKVMMAGAGFFHILLGAAFLAGHAFFIAADEGRVA